MIEVIDADPEARQRTVKVKVAAQYQPVCPTPRPGRRSPGRVRGPAGHPWVDSSRCNAKETGKCGARMAYSLKATGVRAPGRDIPPGLPEHKDAA